MVKTIPQPRAETVGESVQERILQEIVRCSARAIQSERHRIGAYSHGKKGEGSWTGLLDNDIQLKTSRRRLAVFNMKINMRRDSVIFYFENHGIDSTIR